MCLTTTHGPRVSLQQFEQVSAQCKIKKFYSHFTTFLLILPSIFWEGGVLVIITIVRRQTALKLETDKAKKSVRIFGYDAETRRVKNNKIKIK